MPKFLVLLHWVMVRICSARLRAGEDETREGQSHFPKHLLLAGCDTEFIPWISSCAPHSAPGWNEWQAFCPGGKELALPKITLLVNCGAEP